MFKLFWVSSDDDHHWHDEHWKNHHWHDHHWHDHHWHDDHWHLDVDVIHSNEEVSDEEVWQVALDILETEDEIFIIAPIAWVEYENIDLSINKTVLTIKWARQKPQEYDLDWVELKNSECFWWKFIRNIILPENLALNKIRAYMHNNMLVITIPKLKFDTKNIKINKIES